MNPNCRILNFGSINIDHVYGVSCVVRDGETLAANSYQMFAGGKGANQSVALAQAGACVYHAGKIGGDDNWLLDKLTEFGVDMTHTLVGNAPTGHAVIQVDLTGRNAIVIFGGANRQIDREHMERSLSHFSRGDLLLLQNEINGVSHLIEAGHSQELTVCFNPAPYDPAVQQYPLDMVDMLFVNETEASGLVGPQDPTQQLDQLAQLLPKTTILLTLGKQGAMYKSPTAQLFVAAPRVQPVDTTAAGDCFIGYYLASYAAGQPPDRCLHQAVQAAGICVTRSGAMDAIPTRDEVGDSH